MVRLCLYLHPHLCLTKRNSLPILYFTHTDPLRAFSPRKTDPVILHFDDSMRYDLNTETGAKEWAALVPEGNAYEGGEGDDGHLVWLRPDGEEEGEPEAYTVSLFHQLKCLDIIRQEYVSPVPPWTLGRI